MTTFAELQNTLNEKIKTHITSGQIHKDKARSIHLGLNQYILDIAYALKNIDGYEEIGGTFRHMYNGVIEKMPEEIFLEMVEQDETAIEMIWVAAQMALAVENFQTAMDKTIQTLTQAAIKPWVADREAHKMQKRQKEEELLQSINEGDKCDGP